MLTELESSIKLSMQSTKTQRTNRSKPMSDQIIVAFYESGKLSAIAEAMRQGFLGHEIDRLWEELESLEN